MNGASARLLSRAQALNKKESIKRLSFLFKACRRRRLNGAGGRAALNFILKDKLFSCF